MTRITLGKRLIFFLVAVWSIWVLIPETARTQGARALSTRSFTNRSVGSDPFTLTKVGNTITVDLTAIQGAQVYRATLDPYRSPSQSMARYDIRDASGNTLALLPPRYLCFDATEAVQAAMASGSITLTIVDPGQGLGATLSLDVLCDRASPFPVTQVNLAAARFERGDTLISFSEVNPPHTQPVWTVGEYDDAMNGFAPHQTPKYRYRIYRSPVPFTDSDVFASAELVDEILPLSGWNGRLHAFDPTYGDFDDFEIFTLPVDDLLLAAPGTGIYVNRFEGVAPETAYYFVSRTANGAEDFSFIQQGVNATGSVAESAGKGMALKWKEEHVKGPWYWDPYVDMTLDFYVRWAAVPDWNLPSHPFNYRVGIPHDTAVPSPPIEFSPHAWGGSQHGYYEWKWYDKGAALITCNALYYNSYTAFHECARTLRSYGDGTVQPFYHARVLDFIFDFARDEYNLDTNRMIMTGGSMGGAAGHFFGMRSGHLFAHVDAAVGNSIPAEDYAWEFESLGEWGQQSWQTLYSNAQLVRFGYPEVTAQDHYVVWDYFDNIQWLEANRALDTPYMTHSNAPNDPAIAWVPAWKTTRSMIETRRPFNFTWGQNGHGQWTEPLGLDYRLDQSLPAFSDASLDDDLGTTPQNCEPEGNLNRYLLWDTDTVVDTPSQWEMDFHLLSWAPADRMTADVTLRRLQQFAHAPSTGYTWQLTEAGAVKAMGAVAADMDGLITIPGLPFTKAVRRLMVETGSAPRLWAAFHSISARNGGSIDFQIDAGPAQGGRSYFLLGSASGILPGLPLPGGMVVLPLNWDPVTDIIVAQANSPALAGFHGTLDGSGKATAHLDTLGPLPATAAGGILYFAYLLYYPTYYPYDHVSNPAALEIGP